MLPGISRIAHSVEISRNAEFTFIHQTENTTEECESSDKSTKTISCTDSDDGYSKSDENNSFCSAHEVLVECKSAASSTSGLASATSSELKDTTNESSSEVVQKISVSREVNEAIFKPGMAYICAPQRPVNQMNLVLCVFHLLQIDSILDYRLLFRCNGEPKYWHDQNLRDIDFLTEHTKDSLYVNTLKCLILVLITNQIYFNSRVSDDENTPIIGKSKMDHSKIFVRVSLEKNNSSNDDPVIKVHIRNDRLKYPVTLLHLLWINLYEHKIVTMNSISEPITLPMCKCS